MPIRGRSRNGWSTVILEDQWPIDLKTFDAALSPDYIDGSVLRINAELTTGGWPDTAPRIRDEINAMLRNGDPFEKRIAVFPLARVSACLYAGYVLTNRPNVQLFQYHRDDGTWVWPAIAEIGETAEMSTEGTTEPNNIFFAFDLTARVNLEPLLRGLSAVRIIRIGIKSPTSGWLQHPEQLRRLGITAREAFEAALSISSPSTMWHLLYAGPAPGAVRVGQQLNPTMTPKTQLYEYLHPCHTESLTIESNAVCELPSFILKGL